MYRSIISTAVIVTGFSLGTTALRSSTPRFFDDDPVRVEVDTRDASNVTPKSVNLYYDEARSLFATPGDRENRRALNLNTIDEVPDSSWFTNRLIGPNARRSSVADVARGVGAGLGPAAGPWTVLSGKNEGVTPGFTIQDAKGDRWFIKVDPPRYPEMATGAEVVVSRLFHTIGYHVPEVAVATMRREDLVLNEASKIRAATGVERRLRATDIDALLRRAAKRADGSYRVLASKALTGKPVGPFHFSGVRPDDPNDIIPHEHRRELRGLRVFAAWVNHADSKTGNTLDMLVPEEGRFVLRHHLIDFGSTLGSAAVKPREFDEGHEYIVEPASLLANALSLGLYVRPYERVRYENLPAVGRFSADRFDPARWKPRVPNAAFLRARADDLFWGARRVMAFSDEMIRAAVQAAQYSDPRATAHIAETLIARRDRIGQAWLTAVNPVVDPVFDGVALTFRNAAVDAEFAPAPRRYQATWFAYDNATDQSHNLGVTESARVSLAAPAAVALHAGSFVRVDVAAIEGAAASWGLPVRISFKRNAANSWQLVGLERLP
jgi:hypothetical protein